ncbi:hypothetical protein [Saccharopolyspora hattusasensis]|uniref:hypothetical protein n=1 Tax=Saccharopolyspora hattusasensis TaxID=1128679 RepID=UPI003D983C80
MTDNHETPLNVDLPKFSVNVVPTNQIKRDDLETLLVLFRRGAVEPLVFGDDNKPEAAIIPFAAFVRLMRHDHATHVRDEAAFRGELSRRVRESDAARERGEEPGLTIESDEDFYGWAETLGDVGKAWADQRRARDEGHRREE